jgi:hypothetical protein
MLNCMDDDLTLVAAALGITYHKMLTAEARMNPPKILMTLTGGKRCYYRRDGIIVVPIGCLGD